MTAQNDNARPTVIVFDFDGTLIEGDSFFRFILWLYLTSPLRLLIATLGVPVFIALWLMRDGLRRSTSLAFWWVTLGVSDARLLARIDRFLGRRRAAGEVMFPDGVACIHDHLSQGHQVLIATGCAQLLVERMLEQAELELPVVGSTMTRFAGGLTFTEHCFNKNKVRMLRRTGVIRIEIAYSDSAWDLPLLNAADKPVLVNPKEKHYQRLISGLKQTPEVLNWTT